MAITPTPTPDPDGEIREAMAALYASIKTVQCRHECGEGACGPVDMTAWERKEIFLRTGILIPAPTEQWKRLWRQDVRAVKIPTPTGHQWMDLHCPAYRDNRCAVYDYRPLICRVWGAGRGEFACRAGCATEGKRYHIEEVFRLTLRASVITGEMTPEAAESIMADLTDPRVLPSLRRYGASVPGALKELDAAVAGLLRGPESNR